MLKLQRVSDEIFVAKDGIVSLGDEEARFLKAQAKVSPRKRARICAHRSNDDSLHEMLIAISGDSYIHPHKHIGKSESFHVVEGLVDVVILDDEGAIIQVVALGPRDSGRSFFYRLSESLFHTLLIRSEMLVIHEVTNGPFIREQSLNASFAPPESDVASARAYIHRLSEATVQFQNERV